LRYALDADVVIGALDRTDAHHSHARALFTSWRDQDDSVLISVVNLSEVLVAPAADPPLLRAAREAIAALGLAIHSPTEAIGVDASRLRVRHSVSLADAYLLATARQTGRTAVSFDRKVAVAAAAEGIPRLETPER
jgi:predicted nucleic acid-binding protein